MRWRNSSSKASTSTSSSVRRACQAAQGVSSVASSNVNFKNSTPDTKKSFDASLKTSLPKPRRKNPLPTPVKLPYDNSSDLAPNPSVLEVDLATSRNRNLLKTQRLAGNPNSSRCGRSLRCMDSSPPKQEGLSSPSIPSTGNSNKGRRSIPSRRATGCSWAKKRL